MRGGKREGAGRKPGVANKASIARQARVAAEGLTPLDYMLQLMRDDGQDIELRAEMAKAAAPYIHPRLASVTHKGDEDAPLTVKVVRFANGHTSE